MQHLPVLFRDSLLATVLLNGLSPPELLVLLWFAGQGHPLGISNSPVCGSHGTGLVK